MSRTQPVTATTPVDIAHILANERRLAVIDYLADQRAHHINTLADQIASDEHTDPDASDRKAVYVGLYQTHLPTLADANVIDYEQRSGEIARGASFDTVRDARDALVDCCGGAGDV